LENTKEQRATSQTHSSLSLSERQTSSKTLRSVIYTSAVYGRRKATTSLSYFKYVYNRVIEPRRKRWESM